MSVTNDDLKDFADKIATGRGNFSDKERVIIKHLFLTITRNSEAIFKLNSKLIDEQLFSSIATQIVIDAQTEKLTTLYGNPTGADFDFESANSTISQMYSNLNNADNLKTGLEAILGFVQFVAPFL